MRVDRFSAATVILLILTSSMVSFQAYGLGYDDTFVLSVKQKYAIPENVQNGDYVGYWKKTYTWNSVGTISYKIEKNFNNAYAINASSGLITISDYRGINGKIKQQDTTINIIIRTTDSGVGYELDTAQIRVKENAYCKFFDYKYTGTEKGTKTQPFNDLDDIATKAGYGYFVKRGNIIVGESNAFASLIATAKNPTIFGAYGAGNKPAFDGNKTGGFTFVGKIDAEVAGRCEYIYFYDWNIHNYQYYAFKAIRVVGNIGMYNSDISNCEQTPTQSAWIGATSSYADSTANRPHEFINCTIDNQNSCVMKIGVGPVTVTNCFMNGGRVRLTTGMHGIIRHTLVTNCSAGGIEIRGDYNTVLDCRILNSGSDGIGCETNDKPHGPDHIRIKNCYIENSASRAIVIWKGGAGFNVLHDYIIEDCKMVGGDMGIRINSGTGIIIRRNIISGYSSNGGIRINDQYATGQAKNIKMYHNILYNNVNDVVAVNGTNLEYYNNTSCGPVDFSGSTKEIVKNNLCKTITSAATVSNNLAITSTNTSSIFANYANKDFHLKSTASTAINKGVNVGLKNDFCGAAVVGLPDLGAYEYTTASSNPAIIAPPEDTTAAIANRMPVIVPQQFTILESAFANLYIGKVIASDPDSAQKLSYTIVSGNESGLFTINNQTGELTTTSINIFGPAAIAYNLLLQVTDNAEESKSASANITVNLIGETAIVYIDPTNTADLAANGSFDHPYASWQEVTWKEGHAYLQKRGTTAKVEKLLIGANNITIGAYGEGNIPVIESETNTYLVSGFEKKNIQIRYLSLLASNAVSSVYFLGSSCDSITIDHCVLTGMTNAVKIVDAKTFVSKYNTIISEQEGIYSSATTNDIHYNLFKDCRTAINIISNQSMARIYNNVFVDNDQSLSATYADLTLYNNIFYMSKAGQKAITQGSGKIDSDNNIFYPEQEGFVNIANTSYNNLDELQKSLKIDANSFTSDPQFVDMYNDNFKLKSNSPAINSGKNLNIPKDFNGIIVPFAGVADIGIYEFIGTALSNDEVSRKALVMSVFPNPSAGQVNILADLTEEQQRDDFNNGWSELKVVDISGKTIFSKIISRNGSVIQDNIDLSGISNGLYFVILQIADKVIKEKLILNR